MSAIRGPKIDLKKLQNLFYISTQAVYYNALRREGDYAQRSAVVVSLYA